MQRRTFVGALAAGLGTAALPGSVLAAAPGERSWADAFRDATPAHPWLSGYRTASANTFSSQANVTGRWPAELIGTLYRNGPARHEIGDFRYHHWFDEESTLLCPCWIRLPSHIKRNSFNSFFQVL